MKKKILALIILIILTALGCIFMGSCCKGNKNKKEDVVYTMADGDRYTIQVIDGCQYLKFIQGGRMVHKGDCPNHSPNTPK